MRWEPHLYVVLLVARIHHAVVYEMPTAAAPENAIAKSRKFLVASGLSTRHQTISTDDPHIQEPQHAHKFLFKFSVPQSSATIENAARTGMLSRLL